MYTGIGGSLLYLQISINRGQSTARKPHGGGPESLRRQRSVDKARQGRQGLGLARLNNFCRVWSVGTILVGWHLALW